MTTLQRGLIAKVNFSSRPLFNQSLFDWDLKYTWFVVGETKTCKHTGMVLIGSGGYSGSSAHITAVPPDLTPSWMMEGQEEGVTQSRGKSDAFWGLVLQQPLQEIKKLVVLCPLWKHVLLEKTTTQIQEGNVSFKRVNALHSCFKVCTCLSSPLMVCTWLSRSVRPWSTHSSQDAHGGNTSAFCEEMFYYIRFVRMCACV